MSKKQTPTKRQTLARTVYGPQILGEGAPPPPAAAPTGVADTAKLDEVTAEVARTHADLDVVTLTDGQRKLVQNPQTATACVVVKAQAKALAGQPEVVSAASFTPGEAIELSDKHEGLRHGSLVTGEFVRRTGHTQLYLRGRRAGLREDIKAHIGNALKALPADDPRRPRYEAAQAHIKSAEQAAHDKDKAQRDKEDQVRAAALGQIDDAESDLVLAQVLHQLQRGERPSADDLVKAALHLKKVEARARPR